MSWTQSQAEPSWVDSQEPEGGGTYLNRRFFFNLDLKKKKKEKEKKSVKAYD